MLTKKLAPEGAPTNALLGCAEILAFATITKKLAPKGASTNALWGHAGILVFDTITINSRLKALLQMPCGAAEIL